MTEAPAGSLTVEEELDELRRTVRRLERRVARERAAREEAEAIADRGMRNLWLVNRELDERVEARTADLTATLAKLEVATSSRERFLSTLSHEMRTPLNGVLGMLELLEPHVATRGKQYHTTATESALRLNSLIARLLDLVELESGEIEIRPERIAPDALVERIEERWSRPALQSGRILAVSTDTALEVVIDVDRLLQITDELIENALNHSLPGAVRVGIARIDDDLLIEIEDSGPGIDPDLIERLFSDFAMADESTSRTGQGMGLGLGLSRKLAEAIGGALELTSDGVTSTVAQLTVPVLRPLDA